MNKINTIDHLPEEMLRILILEDVKLDVQLIENELNKSGIKYTLQHTDSETSFKKALKEFNFDIILSDFSLPSYNGSLALDEVRSIDRDIPFIFVSGTIGEELAIGALKRGATDFVNKRHLGKLSSAISRAMSETREKHLHIRAENNLERLRKRNIFILDSADEGIAGLDGDNRFVFINRSALQSTGYEISELLGETLDKIIVKKSIPNIENTNATSNIFHEFISNVNLIQIRRKNGSMFTAECTLVEVNEDSTSLGFVLSFRDITVRLKIEEDLAKSYGHMHSILFESIHAMSTALEFRDPYTAGHQKRVAELAAAISRLLRHSEDRTDGIYLAGIVHDIGKIHVPAEILTRPGKISELEYKIIQQHSETGYQILKDVDYPWPIAQAVYQHHERMDSSGYPRRLSGDEIIVEARIISVADVVEAMASHRPYRAALGIDASLAEIRKGSGKIYDHEISEACLSLFEKGFVFPEITAFMPVALHKNFKNNEKL